MILPLSDQPNPRGFVPILTYLLLFLNVAVYVLVTLPLGTQPADPNDPKLAEYVNVVSQNLPQGVSPRQILEHVSAYDLFVFSYGYRPIAPSLLTLFTAMFLHGGFMHLFGNMLFLWIYGDNVEHRLGRLPYLAWYLATGAAATLFHAFFESDSPLPLVGASGAISGILGFYFLWFPRNKVRLWVFLFPFFMNVVLAPARLVLGIYLLLENLLPFLVTKGVEGAGVAHGAHIGGFLAGLAVAWVMNRREVDQHPEEYRAVRRAPSGAKTTQEPIAEAVASANFGEAARLYFAQPPERSRRLLSPEDSLSLGNWLERNGHHRAALVVFQRHLRDYPIGPGAAEAHTQAGLIQLHALGESTAAYQHLVEALDLGPSPEAEKSARNALAEIEARQKFQVRRRRQGF